MADTHRSSPAASTAAAAVAREAVSAVTDTTRKIADAVDGASVAAHEALENARDVWAALDDALQDSVRRRPYTTLAVAGFVGFLYATMRRR